MYIETVPNRGSPPAILLRESFRDGRKVRKRTLANLTGLPQTTIEAMRAALRGETSFHDLEQAFAISRSLPHGHVAAVHGTLRRLGLHGLISARRCRERDLVEAMIVARIIAPQSKLATARGLDRQTMTSSLADVMELQDADEDDLYEAMDWLLARQQQIERKLAKRHLSGSAYYDLTSSYYEGRTCPLIAFGHNRDGKKGKKQIVWGLLCTRQGCPVATSVLKGNVGDPKALPAQVIRLKEDFKIDRVILVGDRGMITEARIRENLAPAGLQWITALRSGAIRGLLRDGTIQPSLFDEQDLAEIRSPDYPGERLMICRNPLLAADRARKRQELLAETARSLDAVVRATQRERKPLRGKAKIGMAVGRCLHRFKMGKHFEIEITEDSVTYRRNQAKIEEEAKLDGIYVIRTNTGPNEVTDEDAVCQYKSLAKIERAFRCMKTVDLKVRPIHHRAENRVRAHVFLCMLAYYVEWHMRLALAPLLFEDDQKAAAEAARHSVVAPAKRSVAADTKAATKRTGDDLPVHSFQTLLADLATIAKNRITPNLDGAGSFDKITEPTPVQQRALDLLGVSLRP